MTRDRIEAWRDYLIEQMHEQYGVAKQEARKMVGRWLQSMEQPAPKAARTRFRFSPRPAMSRTRAARV